ncbi:S49 family peptidase, partial [Streptomyces turgidiscabies]|uniref:S49 family peptidase n=1 Tax=Streptomyces turgidiscabies TaxID=85558 RepID=UPI0038F80A5E
AMDSLTETGFTPAHKEMLQALTKDLNDQLLAGIAMARKIDPEGIHSLVDRGPFVAAEAQQARLIDRIGYEDELKDYAL